MRKYGSIESGRGFGETIVGFRRLAASQYLAVWCSLQRAPSAPLNQLLQATALNSVLPTIAAPSGGGVGLGTFNAFPSERSDVRASREENNGLSPCVSPCVPGQMTDAGHTKPVA